MDEKAEKETYFKNKVVFIEFYFQNIISFVILGGGSCGGPPNDWRFLAIYLGCSCCHHHVVYLR